MSDQTSTVKISSDSAATDNVIVRVELATDSTDSTRALWFSALLQPEKKKRSSYVERKLRKMGR